MDWMIDLETLGTDPDCVILSAGIVPFEKEKKVVHELRAMYMVFDIQAQLNAGRTVTASTLQWWMKQGDSAKEVFKLSEDSTHQLGELFSDLGNVFGSNDLVWGNGSIFDIAIMEHAYRQLDWTPPWKFWNIRDTRTLWEMYPKEKAAL